VVSLQARAGDAPGTVILTADATDADGKVRNVEFFMADSDLFEAQVRARGITQPRRRSR
jgi:hypothetical protein